MRIRLVHAVVVVLVLLGLVITPAVAVAHTQEDPYQTDLIAGGGSAASAMDVGDVLVWNDGQNLYVKYVVTDDAWFLIETHLAIGAALKDIPQTKKGNPIPGQFARADSFDEEANVTQHTYSIPLTDLPAGTLYIAAHAVVSTISGYSLDLVALELALPDQVTMKVSYPYNGGPSYFPTVTLSGGTILDGLYAGWCFDIDHYIYQNTSYQAAVYSTYETLPAGMVEHPENLDKVNYILNQGYVGTSSPGGYGTYTYGDVQRAIWALVEDTQSTNSLGPWNQNRVNEILADANANGEGFEPGPGGIVAVVLAPLPAGAVQIIAIEVPLSQLQVVVIEYADETAWAEGEDFPGANWAMYFEYAIQ